MLVSTSKEEVGGLFHNDKTAANLRININELGFPRPQTPIKRDNYATEGIVTDTIIQKSSKTMDMIFIG